MARNSNITLGSIMGENDMDWMEGAIAAGLLWINHFSKTAKLLHISRSTLLEEMMSCERSLSSPCTSFCSSTSTISLSSDSPTDEWVTSWETLRARERSFLRTGANSLIALLGVPLINSEDLKECNRVLKKLERALARVGSKSQPESPTTSLTSPPASLSSSPSLSPSTSSSSVSDMLSPATMPKLAWGSFSSFKSEMTDNGSSFGDGSTNQCSPIVRRKSSNDLGVRHQSVGYLSNNQSPTMPAISPRNALEKCRRPSAGRVVLPSLLRA